MVLFQTYIKGCIFRVFKKFSFKEKFDYHYIYPTTHDAVLSILRKNKVNIKPPSKRKPSIHVNLDGEGKNEDETRKPVYIKRKMSNIFDDITAINPTTNDDLERIVEENPETEISVR